MPRTASLNDFEHLALLSNSATSTVYKVLNPADGETYVLKKVKLPLSDEEKQIALNEVRLMTTVTQPSILAYKEAFLDDTGCLCIVQEFADGGDLFQRIEDSRRDDPNPTHLREADVWRFIEGMCQGLKVLHDSSILHRNLKCTNVLFHEGPRGLIAKLGDFNAKLAKRGMEQTGTLHYISPEVWRNMPYEAHSDMWSLGCVIYEMVALRPPFTGDSTEGIYRKVMRGQYPRIPAHYSHDLAEVIACLLQVNPQHRPSVDQLLHMPVMRRLFPTGFGSQRPMTACTTITDVVATFATGRDLVPRDALSGMVLAPDNMPPEIHVAPDADAFESGVFAGMRRRFSRNSEPTWEPQDLDFQQMAIKKFGPKAMWNSLSIQDQVELIKENLTQNDFLINPHSEYMKYWDLIITVCLVYTALVTPYEIAFLKPSYSALYFIGRFLDLVFFKDMVMQFFIKVQKVTPERTTWLRSKKEIAVAYLKGWFLIDFLSILPYDHITDIVNLFSDESPEGLDKLKILRLLRVLRLIKLVRILKASKLVVRWQNRVSVKFGTQHTIKFMVLIAIASHWMACVWGFVGLYEGTNLVCRSDIAHPTGKYFIDAPADGNSFDPAAWEGNSWVIAFAEGRAAENTINPCEPFGLWMASLYWAVMTLTSIGYGDILPRTLLEYILCTLCMLMSGVCWAYVVGGLCSVAMSSNPERLAFEERMDSFNRMCESQKIPQETRWRGRQFIREARFHNNCVSDQEVRQGLGEELQGAIANHMASHYLSSIWYFKSTGVEFRQTVSNKFTPNFFEKREQIPIHSSLCVVERGTVGRGGIVLVRFNFWGEEMIVANTGLHSSYPAQAMTYTEILSISRGVFKECLAAHPKEISGIKRAAAFIALARAIQVYRSERKKVGKSPQYLWLHKLFDASASFTDRESRQLEAYKRSNMLSPIGDLHKGQSTDELIKEILSRLPDKVVRDVRKTSTSGISLGEIIHSAKSKENKQMRVEEVQ